MSTKPTAESSANAAETTNYPRKRKIVLELEFSFEDSDEESYIFSGENVQVGFVADLFDILNHDNELGVCSINGISQEDIKKLMPLSQ